MLLQLSKTLRSMVSEVKVHDVLLKVAHGSLTLKYNVVAVQLLSCVLLFATPQTAACQASLSFTVSWYLLKLMFIELMMPSNQLAPSPCVLSLAQHQAFFQEGGSLHQVA